MSARTGQRCARSWEVEAARDGRLVGAARDAFMLHLARCQDCTRERDALHRLSAALQATPPPDDDDPVSARRLRQQVLAEANRVLLERPAQTMTRLRTTLRTTLGRRPWALHMLTRRAWHWPAMVVSALALISVAALLPHRQRALPPEPVALQLSAAPGARFTHERRAGLEYVDLREGSLDIRFDRTRGAALLVRTPDAELHDLGTVFRVRVEHGRTTELIVREGAVMLRRPGVADRMVTAGNSYRALDPTAESEQTERESPQPSAARPATQVVQGAPHVAAPPLTKARTVRARASDEQPPAQPDTSQAVRSPAEREDSAYLRVLTLTRQGRQREARAAAEEYRREFPDGFRRNEVERIALPALP